MYSAKSCSTKERIELPSDEGIASHIPLEVYKTFNGFPCVLAFGMEKCRTVITFYHRYRPALFQERAEPFQRTLWLGKMFKHETDKDMIESLRRERKLKNISLAESNIDQAFLPGHILCPLKRICRYIYRRYMCTGAVFCEDDGLGTDPAAGLQHMGSRRILRVVMKKPGERLRLVKKPF
jgi:hypothetical protein